MPATTIHFYRDDANRSTVLEWLRTLRANDPKAYATCVARIRRLAELGHELRRPEGDYLRDGIYELRARKGRVNYRILYFFHGRNVAILTHAITKQKQLPAIEIDRAIARKRQYEVAPQRHTHEENLTDA